jgi:hypothetical protein
MKASDLIPDSKNCNRGTKRGRKMVADSLREYGAGRSVLVDKDDRIIAGNTTATNAGDMPVRVVETDGTELVVVKRTDLSLDDPKARSLAIADNRASEIGLEWDVANLQALQPEVDLKPFFTGKELDKMSGQAPEELTLDPNLSFAVIVRCESEQQQATLLERFAAEGLTCEALTT